MKLIPGKTKVIRSKDTYTMHDPTNDDDFECIEFTLNSLQAVLVPTDMMTREHTEMVAQVVHNALQIAFGTPDQAIVQLIPSSLFSPTEEGS